MPYRIRQFRGADAGPLSELTLAAIEVICPARYSLAQVDAWAARHRDTALLNERGTEGRAIFVATNAADTPVAFALIEQNGHVDQLYCHPQHTRKGLANMLLAAAEDHARASGIDRLYAEASELARPAFERAEYLIRNRRDFAIGGVPIHNFAMKKTLEWAAFESGQMYSIFLTR